MAGLTKEQRQEIVREFATRHNGTYNPKIFLDEVRTSGPTHPAYEWFEWDNDRAAYEYQLSQAREFARNLKVTFRVEEVTGPHSVRIRETAMPMVLSPVETRGKGGGYVLVDPEDPEHIAELCKQAAISLSQWLLRYQSALAHAGVKPATVETIIGTLEVASLRQVTAQQ